MLLTRSLDLSILFAVPSRQLLWPVRAHCQLETTVDTHSEAMPVDCPHRLYVMADGRLTWCKALCEVRQVTQTALTGDESFSWSSAWT